MSNEGKGMRRKYFVFTALMFILVLTACGKKVAESTDQPTLPFAQELQNALDNGLEQYGGKGISGAVIVPGYETWVGVSGVSHGTTAITPDTLFSAGPEHGDILVFGVKDGRIVWLREKLMESTRAHILNCHLMDRSVSV